MKAAPWPELDRDAEGVAHCKAEEKGGYLIYQRFIAHSAFS
jgi:hypothetical protein